MFTKGPYYAVSPFLSLAANIRFIYLRHQFIKTVFVYSYCKKNYSIVFFSFNFNR